MRPDPVTRLNVLLHRGPERERLPVGRLALSGHRILFEYDSAFVETRLELSPLKLPLSAGVKEDERRTFDGLFGVFNDSLPDGWGRLLLDRELRRRGIDPSTPTPLDRLAHVGDGGMGALAYEPAHDAERLSGAIDLHRLAKESRRVLEGGTAELLHELFQLGGSSGGARPKVLVQLSADGREVVAGDDGPRPGFEPYLVKFSAGSDPKDCGAIEHAYALMAKAAGIEMEETRLLARDRRHPGYFATRRFDRRDAERVHVHSLGGLLHADHRIPSLDYDTVLRATRALTRDDRELTRQARRMAFNVLAHNRDDHAKNFAFAMEADGTWRLTPAYDLTFSDGPRGEHATMVAGEGAAPGEAQIAQLAKLHGIGPKAIRTILDEVRAATSRWASFAIEAGVSKRSAQRIQKGLSALAR